MKMTPNRIATKKIWKKPPKMGIGITKVGMKLNPKPPKPKGLKAGAATTGGAWYTVTLFTVVVVFEAWTGAALRAENEEPPTRPPLLFEARASMGIAALAIMAAATTEATGAAIFLNP